MFGVCKIALLFIFVLSNSSKTLASSSSGSGREPRYYVGTDIQIPDIPEKWQDWSIDWPKYERSYAVEYTAENLEKTAGLTDVDSEHCLPGTPDWLRVYNRDSYEPHQYSVSRTNGRPLNPRGRTGISGRGILGRWGPNHCADIAVTRYNQNNKLQLALTRRRGHKWALPGGKRYPNEGRLEGLKRQFCEKALANNNDDIEYLDQKKFWDSLDSDHVYYVYEGMGGSGGKKVESKVNTDNAWIETVVYNFHDSKGLFDRIQLTPSTYHGSEDAGWFTFEEIQHLYKDDILFSSHIPYIEKVAEIHGLKGYSVSG